MQKRNTKYIFVGGMPRSGVTLTGAWICTHPKATPHVEEATILEDLLLETVKYEFFFDKLGKHYWNSRTDAWQFFQTVVYLFLSQFRRKFPRTDVIVLRRPQCAELFPVLNNMLLKEDVSFVVTLRDPRDSYASWVKVQEEIASNPERGEILFPRKPELWCKTFSKIYSPYLNGYEKADQFKKRIHFVRYEHLVHKTQQTLEELENKLNITINKENPWANSMIDYDSYESPWKSKSWGKTITSKHIGCYKQVLFEEEIQTIERLCSKFFDVFGYKKDWYKDEKTQPGLWK